MQPCLTSTQSKQSVWLKAVDWSSLCAGCCCPTLSCAISLSHFLSLTLLPFIFIQRCEKICPLLLRNLEYFKRHTTGKVLHLHKLHHNEGVFPALSSLMPLQYLLVSSFALTVCKQNLSFQLTRLPTLHSKDIPRHQIEKNLTPFPWWENCKFTAQLEIAE